MRTLVSKKARTWQLKIIECSSNVQKWRKQARFFNEKNMKVIRNIFKEEFEKQENNIRNLISANIKITMEEIKKSQDEIKNLGKEICDLRSSLYFTENVLEEKVKKLENDTKVWRQNYERFAITK